MSESRGGESRWSSYGYTQKTPEPTQKETKASSYTMPAPEPTQEKSKDIGNIREQNSTNKASDTLKNPYDKLLLDMYKSDPNPYMEGVLEALGILPKEENKRKHTDIGDIRNQVLQELYGELYEEIKQEVRQELEKEKTEIVREIKDEIKAGLKEDLKRKLFLGRGEDR